MNAQFPFDNTYSTLPSQFFHKQKPATVSKAKLIACNFKLAKELEIEVGEVVAISESGGNMPIPVMRAEAFAKDMSMSLPGQERIEARVNVSFNIVQ